ncbi:MAG: NTP transferase domain-containing protein [Candidatus Hydrothermarchaeales archaeon]
MRLPALLMAGGEGERLESNEEKPLFLFHGRPMVDWVREALLSSNKISYVYVAVSSNTRETEAHLRRNADPRMVIVETPGAGYVEDMSYALKEANLYKALTTSSDMPLLTPADIDYVIEEYKSRGGIGSMAVLVPIPLVNQLGLTTNYPLGENAATGINIVDLRDARMTNLVTRRVNLAANINTRSDVEIALRLHNI